MIKKFSASIGSDIFLRIDHLNKENQQKKDFFKKAKMS